MSVADRLLDADPEIQEVFARGRAAVAGLDVNGGKVSDLDDDSLDSIAEMLLLRERLGWSDES